jgi:acetyl-CoA carboxylase biotin carboxylase subunit
MYGRVLVANRGEIARRVIRACAELGIESVAVYSEPDRDAPFVREADDAVCIGPAKASQSYLNIAAILDAAAHTRSQAIHPGYGFLSENALFAQMVMQARLGWMGPPPSVIRTMGEKSSAKAAAQAAGLPVVPGSDGLVASIEEALTIAEDMGYPVLLKADAGGGGRGMRKAESPDELKRGWDEARREAASAFGNDAMYMEKFLGNSRHIEFQVLADRWGNAVHLFERECSIQRRHQKLLEEAPSTALSPQRRAEMGERVARAAQELGYEGAGTVEFLLDSASSELYFIEMNTRLQVEHPVTEMVTDIDLVQAQIRIAAGEKLWFAQEDVSLNGHAIELRLNAEDPDDGFRPSPGAIERFHVPEPSGEGRLRIDAAVDEGSSVSPYYDSMIAKIIGWGNTRDTAIATCSEALSGMELRGVPTTASLHLDVLGSAEFSAGTLQVGVIPGRPDLSEVAAATTES